MITFRIYYRVCIIFVLFLIAKMTSTFNLKSVQTEIKLYMKNYKNYVAIRVCMYLCVFACVYVYVCMCVRAHARGCVYKILLFDGQCTCWAKLAE